MPNCVVKGCKHQTSRHKKQDGITFHTFPIRNENVKEKWIEVIRISRNEPSWNPTAHSVVCSVHFENEDLYYTKKRLRRVLRNGYPKNLPSAPDQSTNTDLSESTTINAHVPVTPSELKHEPIDVDPLQPCTSQAHVPVAPVESIKVEPIQPCTSQALRHIPVTPIESIKHVPISPIESIKVDPIQPCTSQAHAPVTPVESSDVDPLQPCTSQAHVPVTPVESTDVDPLQPCTSQAVSATPVLSTKPILNMETGLESIFDTPRKHKLRQRIFRLENQRKGMKTKIKSLHQNVRRLQERNNSLKERLDNFKKAKLCRNCAKTISQLT